MVVGTCDSTVCNHSSGVVRMEPARGGISATDTCIIQQTTARTQQTASTPQLFHKIHSANTHIKLTAWVAWDSPVTVHELGPILAPVVATVAVEQLDLTVISADRQTTCVWTSRCIDSKSFQTFVALQISLDIFSIATFDTIGNVKDMKFPSSAYANGWCRCRNVQYFHPKIIQFDIRKIIQIAHDIACSKCWIIFLSLKWL